MAQYDKTFLGTATKSEVVTALKTAVKGDDDFVSCVIQISGVRNEFYARSTNTHRASSSRNDDQWEFCNIDEKNYQHWVATERYTEDTVTANVTVYKLRSEK
ncbi:hypothetical protein L486_02657 [Kwoniella mangroviensis CBS 10435]|uniref:Uncharacterized protein n=1 Tax=Kwoniella mangroviensis CBS 10435 TaxID=1331196 RepID=A0A1B9IX35_9TREE|nr:hypothetical protein L486_02657 [Kwoniella mangroviensis CBS 10435]